MLDVVGSVIIQTISVGGGGGGKAVAQPTRLM